MQARRPPPGEELNFGPPTPPRPAATVLVVRGGEEALEVLLVQRSRAARFMAGVWVFPGGAVDDHEGEGDPAHRLAAVREVQEETGVTLLDPGALVLLSRWITPSRFRIRFDTSFFLAELPPAERVRIDGIECVDFAWCTPADALAAVRRGEKEMVLPTIHHLELLDDHPSAAEALRWARGRRVDVVEPQIAGSGDQARVVLPGEPGWKEPQTPG